MERFEADLVRMTRIDRDTGTVKFLYGELRRGEDRDIGIDDVSAQLARLERRGWVERTPGRGSWRITPAGEVALQEDESWEFMVEEVVQITGRPDLIAAGVVDHGTVHIGDRFRVKDDGDRTGRVVGVELIDRRDHPGLISLTVAGAPLQPGDIFVRWDPRAEGLLDRGRQEARAAVRHSSLLPFSFAGTYKDDVGSETITMEVRPDTSPSRSVPSFDIRAIIRGVEFAGFDFDGLDPVDPVAAQSAGFELPASGELTGCVLSGNLPCAIDDNGHRIAGEVEFSLDLTPSRQVSHDPKNLELTVRLGGKTFTVADNWFEDGLHRLEATLPEGVRLVCCLTCLYSDYSPGGHGLTGMICHRGAKDQYLAVRSKREYWSVPATEEVMETHLCAEYQRRVPGTGYRG